MQDPVLDQYLTKNDPALYKAAAASYRQIFLDAVLDRPFLYIRKVIHQLCYGAWFSWPPHGLGELRSGPTSAEGWLLDIMKQHGLAAMNLRNQSIRGWSFSDLGRPGTLLFRALSAGFVAAVAASLVIAARGRRPEFSTRACIVICSVGGFDPDDSCHKHA